MKRSALRRWIPFRLAALVAPLIAAWPTASRGGSLTWDGNGNTSPNPDGGTGTWDSNTSLNWWNGISNVVWPVAGGTDDDAVFGNTAGTVSIAAGGVGGGVFANDLTFNTTGYLIQSNSLILTGSTPTITTAPGVSATISSIVAGNAGLTKAGNGTLILNNTANTYFGGTTVSAGMLQLGDGAINTNFTGTYAIGSGGTLRYLRAADTTAPAWANVSGAGVLSLMTNRANSGTINDWGQAALQPDFTGTLQIERGRVFTNTQTTLGNATAVTVLSGGHLGMWNGGTFGQNFTIAGSGYGEVGYESALRLANAGITTAVNGSVTLSADATLAATGTGILNNTVAGTGNMTFGTSSQAGTVQLNGTGNWSGTTTIGFGTVRFGRQVSLYNGNTGSWTDTNLIVNSGSTAAFSVGGAGEFTAANLDAIRVLGTGTGGFKSGSLFGIDTSNAVGGFTYSSAITNTNAGTNVLGLSKLGAGTLILTGASTYTGNTVLGGGTLEIGSGGSLGTGGSYAGIISGAGNLTKSAAGTQILMGANTFTGVTTISNGTLQYGNGTTNGTVNPGVQNVAAGATMYLNYATAVAATTNTGWASRITGPGLVRLNSAQAVNGTANWGPNLATALPFGYGFTGTLQIDNGRIDSQPIGLGSMSNMVINSGAQFLSWTGIYSQAFTLSGDGWGETGQPGALRVAAGSTAIYNGNVTMTADSGINSQDGNAIMTINGVVGGGFNLAKHNPGLLSLRGANTYSGTTTINGGTFELAGAGTLTGGSYSPALTIGTGTTFRYSSSSNQTLSGIVGGAGAMVANGPGTLTLSGANAYTGATTVGGGTLALDFDTNDNSKLDNAAVLTLNGGTVTLAGNSGTHLEAVGSTTLGGGATINRSGTNTAVLALGALTRNVGGALEVAATGVATTTTGNTNGVLPGVTLGGGLAMNDGFNNIVAYTGAYTDVNRLGGTISNGASNHVRVIEAGASGSMTLDGAGTNTIATLTNTGTGGVSAVDIASGRILRVGTAGSILSPSTSAGLTIGGAGTLTAGGADNTAGGLLILNQSTVATDISSLIANNGTGAVTLTKSGSGPLTLSGSNTFTGGSNINGGTVTARVNVGQNALGTGAVAVSGGSSLVLNNVSTATGPVNISNVFSGNGSIQLLFADGTVNPRNTLLNGASALNNFNGTLRLSLAPAAVSTADKWSAGGITTQASVLVDPGTQLFVGTAANIYGGVTVSGTGNSEGRGAIRLTSTLGAGLTLAGDTSIGTEGGTLLGGIMSGAAGTQTLTLGTANSTGNATINGSIGGGTGTIALVKNMAGTVTLKAPSTYTGGTTINAGILSVGSGGTGSATASETALGTGAVTVNTGGTLRLWIKNDAPSTIGNSLNLNGGTIRNEDGNHTLSGAVFVDTLGGTLTSQFDAKNLTLSNVISGPGNLTTTTASAATSRVILTNANTYGGTTTLGSGTLSLAGASGAILNSSSLTAAFNSTLRLDNTPLENNGDRLPNGMPVTLSGATFNFAHTAGPANYAETAGALTLGAGNAVVTASQALPGQTSALTFASLTRNAGSIVDFNGGGLGVDTRNRILFSANPNVDGIIGPWSTYNGGNFATYDNALGVREFTGYTDVVRLTGNKVIANAAGSHVRLTEGSGILTNLTLGSAVTNVATISNSIVGGASAGTIDLNGRTLRLSAAGGVRSMAGAGALTIGLPSNSGVLTAGGADNTAGRISFLNASGNTITINSAITDNGTGGVSVESLSGNLTLGGTVANTFSGGLTISTQGSANTRSVTLAKPLGVPAVAANSTINFGLGTSGEANLRMGASGQFGSNVLMVFQNPNGAWARFDLMGTHQALAGITTPSIVATQHGAVIQNREFNNSTSNRGTSFLTLTGSGTYQYNGYVRDADSGVNATNLLGVIKSGSGTQTLAGSQIGYSGPTNVSGGTLRLTDTTAFVSPIINSATVELNSTAVTTVATAPRAAGAIAGAGTFNKTGPGLFRLNGASQPVVATGQFNVQQGTLQNDGNSVNWSANIADMDVSAGAILDLYADPIYVDALTGSGFVQNNYGNATGQSGSAANIEKFVMGTNGGNGAFAGIIRDNAFGTAPAATTAGGGVQIEKVGNGTQVLSGANTYTGSTTVNGGTLQLDFAAGGTSNIIAAGSVLNLGGGTLELKGGSGETNTQTVNGVSGTGQLLLTPNGAASINASLGAITGTGSIDFAGGNTTIGAGVSTAGTLNFITGTAAGANDGATRLGAHLWNGNTWASTATNGAGTTYVVPWQGTYSDIYNGTNPGPVAIPSGTPAAEVRILEATSGFANNTLGANETINSLLMTAGTTAATVDMGANTLTVGNGAGATGAVAIGSAAKSLTIGAAAGQGTLTAGASGASNLVLTNQSSTSTLTVNSVIANNAGAGAVSVTADGSVVFNGANTYTGTTMITGGTLQIGSGSTTGALGTGAVTNNGTLIYNRSDANTWANVISGPGTLVKKGGDILTLTSASTWTGGTTISTGSVQWNVAGALGTGTITLNDAATGTSNTALVSPTSTGLTLTNNILVRNQGTGTTVIGSNGGATANFQTYSGILTLEKDVTLQGKSVDRTTFSGRITGTGNVTIDAAGTVDGRVTLDNNTNDFAGNVTVNTGAVLQTNGVSVIPDASNVTVNGKLFFNSASETINGLNGNGLVQIHPAVTFNPSTLTVGGAGGSGNFSGVIQNGGTGTVSVALNKIGTGTQIISGANLYTGATTVNGGVLQVGNGGATGQLGTGAVTIGTGAALSYNRTGAVLQTGAINSASTWAGTVNINGDGTTAVSLNAAGNFSGTFNVNGGALVAAATNPWSTALTAPTFNIAAGAALAAGTGSNHAHIGALNLSGGTVSTAPGGTGSYDGENFQLNGDVNVTGTVPSLITRDGARTNANSGISLRGIRTFTVADVTGSSAADLLVSTELENTDSGTIATAGLGGLIKAGPGTMSLAGTHSYTGITTVNAGTLQLEAGSSIAASSLLTVNGTATLSGSGATGPVAFTAGSSVRPGSSPGILNTGSATSAADLYIEIGGATAGNGTGFHDQINTTGSLTLNGGLLTVSLIDGFVPSINDNFDIWLNDGADAILGSGTFTGLPEGSQIPVPETSGGAGGGLNTDYWLISYFGGTGNDIRLTYVPEPSSAMLAAGAGLLALSRRRRKA